MQALVHTFQDAVLGSAVLGSAILASIELNLNYGNFYVQRHLEMLLVGLQNCLSLKERELCII